jgi:hypothetical protein
MTNAFERARQALQTKPKGPDTRTHRACKGRGCRGCNGWGWELTPGYCTLPQNGRVCPTCPKLKGCKK